jgi:hypothetical protein
MHLRIDFIQFMLEKYIPTMGRYHHSNTLSKIALFLKQAGGNILEILVYLFPYPVLQKMVYIKIKSTFQLCLQLSYNDFMISAYIDCSFVLKMYLSVTLLHSSNNCSNVFYQTYGKFCNENCK